MVLVLVRECDEIYDMLNGKYSIAKFQHWNFTPKQQTVCIFRTFAGTHFHSVWRHTVKSLKQLKLLARTEENPTDCESILH